MTTRSLRCRVARATTIVLFASTSAIASADDKRAAEPPPKTVTEADRSRARSLFDEGMRHYDLQEYVPAIDRFKEAYALVSAPELLFNIAQAYRLRGADYCSDALWFYNGFLRSEPPAAKRASAEAAARDMEKCAAARPTPAPAPPPTPVPAIVPFVRPEPPPAPPPSHGLSRGLIIGGVAVSVAGGGLLLWSGLRHSAIEDSGCAPACDPSRTDAPRAAQTIGGIAIGVGAAVFVTGFVVLVLENGKSVSPKDGAAKETAFDRIARGIRF